MKFNIDSRITAREKNKLCVSISKCPNKAKLEKTDPKQNSTSFGIENYCVKNYNNNKGKKTFLEPEFGVVFVLECFFLLSTHIGRFSWVCLFYFKKKSRS